METEGVNSGAFGSQFQKEHGHMWRPLQFHASAKQRSWAREEEGWAEAGEGEGEGRAGATGKQAWKVLYGVSAKSRGES